MAEKDMQRAQMRDEAAVTAHKRTETWVDQINQDVSPLLDARGNISRVGRLRHPPTRQTGLLHGHPSRTCRQ